MAALNISPASIERHYRKLDKIGVAGSTREAGYIRTAYSVEETSVIEYIAQAAKGAGLLTRCDGIGNLIVETPGNYNEYVETGSHADTVPFGGNYDGLAGIVAGLEAIIMLHRSSEVLKKGLRLRVWRGEESAAFGYASMGSRGAFGCLHGPALKASYKGHTLEEWMHRCGVDSECIKKGVPALSQEEIDSISAYVELHIEQGNFLEVKSKDIGIVSGVRGPARYLVHLMGEFDHSGATPMGSEYRKDTNLALGYILVALHELAQEHLNKGMDLVQTMGVINSINDLNDKYGEVYKNAISKVSGFAYFSFEVRSCNENMNEYCKNARLLIEKKAKEMGVETHIEELSFTPGIDSLHMEIRESIEKSCRETGASFLEMVSGAWHDAAVIAEQKRSDGSLIPSGLIFIPCRNGKSHSPDEYSRPDQIAKGAIVLAKTLLKLAME
ncbi:MAG: hydantoinase/carbamoylase family amidase [Deltaproteobacteria bacterium]|nr:hydantoinase/carbamoylase family amidase [Deltaproteobacteria bacterium]